MPLSEFHSSMKGNHQTNNQKMTSCSPTQSTFWPERDFMEILWENGQVVMQGQTNRSKRGMFAGALPLPSGRTKEKETGDAETPKVSRYRFPITDAEGSSLQPTGTQGQIVLGSHEDEMAPWLNSPMDDYCLEFLSEFSGSTYPLYSTVPADRNSSYGQPVRDAHGLEHETFSRIPSATLEHSRMTNNQLFSFPQQSPSLFSSSKCKDSSTMTNNLHLDPIRDLPSVKVHKQECSSSKSVPPNSSPSLMNFSHFTRPFALAKANLFGADRMRSCEKVSTAASSSPVESALIDSTSGLKCNSSLDGQLTLVADTADLGPSIQCSKEMDIARHLEAICSDHARKTPSNYRKMDNFSNLRKLDVRKFQDSDLKAAVLHETENNEQPVIASSSVCSVNGAVPMANDSRSQVKRKCQEGEESEYASEDHDDDSMDVKRPSSGQNIKPKRSRAAEVHNLSERRRRDRINEKMRALQELLPNCNKVDKASMLDEAIEYLKTLQMQVQIMSMGPGLCLPSMLIPTGLQNIHTPQMAPFSPMGVGMGMGMGFGYGMGMLDMMRSPLIPVPHMHGPPYPCPSIPGTPGLHGMPASSSLQMFGLPRQPLPVTHPPNFIPFTGMATKVNSVPEEPVADVNPLQASDSILKSSKNPQPDTGEQVAKMGTDKTPAESSRQENNEFSEPPLVSIDNQHPEVGDHDEPDGGDGIHLPP